MELTLPPRDGSPALTAVCHGRHVIVRPVVPADYEWLYRTAVLTPAGGKWRLFGEVPPFDQFLSILFQGAKATCLITTVTEQRPVGMVQLWSHDPLSRNGHLTTFLDPAENGKGWPLEGVILFADYVFRAYDLIKIYVEALEPSYDVYRSLVAGGVLVEEGRLRQHRYVMGEYVDCHLLALYRETFYGRLQSEDPRG